MAVIINPLGHTIEAVRCSLAVLQIKFDCDGSTDDSTEGGIVETMDGICVGRVFPE